jgi:hypothetical protein
MPNLKCFVMMPFEHAFDPVFKGVQQSAANAVPNQVVDCYWLKDVHAAGQISEDIIRALQESDLCIADITSNNANVMWETGYAMALGKPTIIMAQSTSALPFDLITQRVLLYSPDQLEGLQNSLAMAICQTMERYSIKPGSGPLVDAAKAVAVTGSRSADRPRVRRRIETLLIPYLNPNLVWYCGSNGSSDEEIAHYLVSQKQKVYAVGYNAYDLSNYFREAIQDGTIRFIDASIEAMPRTLGGAMERDIFFTIKADLIVLLWDGTSRGTQSLIEYFQQNAKNLLLGFI